MVGMRGRLANGRGWLDGVAVGWGRRWCAFAWRRWGADQSGETQPQVLEWVEGDAGKLGALWRGGWLPFKLKGIVSRRDDMLQGAHAAVCKVSFQGVGDGDSQRVFSRGPTSTTMLMLPAGSASVSYLVETAVAPALGKHHEPVKMQTTTFTLRETQPALVLPAMERAGTMRPLTLMRTRPVAASLSCMF